MNTAPKTIEQEIAEAINALLSRGDRFWDWNGVEVTEIRDKISKLQKVDSREAFAQHGALAAICGRPEDLAEFYRKARLLPNKTETDNQFWRCFSNVGQYSFAHSIGSKLLDPKLGFFPKYWERAVSGGHIREVYENWSATEKTFPDLNKEDLGVVRDAARVMIDRGLSDADIVAILDLMGEVQREHQIMFSGQHPLILRVIEESEDPSYLYAVMHIDATIDEVQAMNRKVAALVAQRLGAFPSGLVMSFRKAVRREQLPIAA